MRTRYLVFAGDDHSPGGGAQDFIETWSDPGSAALGMPRDREWAHVAELHDGRLTIVAELRSGKLEVYPERMAHMQALAAEAPGSSGS
jgi:hypothetical protein